MKQENPGFNAEGRRGGEREASDESPVLLRLQERFERFRRGTVRWTRVPADLRAAVLEAVRQGVTLTEVRRACGLSLSQLRLWGAAEVSERCTLPGKSTGLGDRVRVFSVGVSGLIRHPLPLVSWDRGQHQT